MEELLVRIGEMLDEKLAVFKEELRAEFKQELEEVKTELRAEFKQGLEELKTELRAEFKQGLEKLKTELRAEFKQEITNAKEELRKEMLDQFFLFEQKYGDRIITVGELALLDNQKNLERAEKMHQLEERMNKNEASIYACQHEIFALQQKVK